MDFAREGDVIHIHDFSRLARSTKDLLEIVELLHQKGVTLISNKENIDTGTPTGKLMLTMIGAINEFERTNLLERQREGIEIAKREKRYKGRRSVVVPDFEKHYRRYLRREINKTELARELNISRPTLDKFIAEYLSNQKEKASTLDYGVPAFFPERGCIYIWKLAKTASNMVLYCTSTSLKFLIRLSSSSPKEVFYTLSIRQNVVPESSYPVG